MQLVCFGCGSRVSLLLTASNCSFPMLTSMKRRGAFWWRKVVDGMSV